MKIKMKNSLGFLILVLVLGEFLSSCKHRKEITSTEPKPPIAKEDSAIGRCRLDYKNAKTLSRLMQENEFDYTWIFAKATVESFVEEKEESFDIRLSLRKDSAMLVNIQYVLGINVAKVLITKDSVKFVDYIHKTYFIGDFAYINDLLSADIDFDLLQSVLFGNSAKFYDDDSRLKPITDRQNCNYMLSTERKKRLKRIINNAEEPSSDLQILTLNPDGFKIIRNEFEQSSTGRKFIANYSAFAVKDSVYAPYHVDIDILAQKAARLKINYVRIEKNSPQKLSLNIPAKYDAIQIQKK
jgi:hypothetical protein